MFIKGGSTVVRIRGPYVATDSVHDALAVPTFFTGEAIDDTVQQVLLPSLGPGGEKVAVIVEGVVSVLAHLQSPLGP